MVWLFKIQHGKIKKVRYFDWEKHKIQSFFCESYIKRYGSCEVQCRGNGFRLAKTVRKFYMPANYSLAGRVRECYEKTYFTHRPYNSHKCNRHYYAIGNMEKRVY